MKTIAAVLITVCVLTGCVSTDTAQDQAISMRKQILAAESCSFHAAITATYADAVYTFQMECFGNSTGDLQFTVTDPETIHGISGDISDSATSVIFDDNALTFPILADGKLSPVSAPWIFLKTLRGGYLSGCRDTDNGLVLSIDDSYMEDSLHLEIYTDSQLTPTAAEIYWQQKCVITLNIRDFTLM